MQQITVLIAATLTIVLSVMLMGCAHLLGIRAAA
jgi:hypothetical protein